MELGIDPAEVKLVTRSRKSYGRMSGNRIVQRALTNAWPHLQGVPDMKAKGIAMHYGNNGVPV